jgi:hypothetical protein
VNGVAHPRIDAVAMVNTGPYCRAMPICSALV